MDDEIKKGVLIIEDNFDHYEEVSRVFQKYSWKIFPDKEDYIDNWDELFLEETRTEINNFIEKYIKRILPEIGTIILDINLKRGEKIDLSGINTILPTIRALSPTEKEFKKWGKRIPIIALTNFPPGTINRIALTGDEHVDVFFKKDDFFENPDLLVFTAQSLFSTFKLRTEEALRSVLYDEIKGAFEYLENVQKAIISKFEDVEIILKGEFESVKAQLKLILHALLQQMEQGDMEKFVPEFSSEIKNELGDEQFEKIKKNLEKASLKEDFINCIKNGKLAEFSDFLTKTYEELCKSGTINIFPFGKFIGMGLTTVLKIMSK